MSIERVSGEVVAHCDSCPEYLDTGEEDFRAGVAAIKRVGWGIKHAGEWVHTCPACLEKEREKR